MELADYTYRELLDSVAARTPTPGGGAAASMTAALAAALAQMVLNFSLGKKSLAEHESANADAMERLSAARERAFLLAEADAVAYARLNDLWKLKRDDPRRITEFAGAVDAAISAPQALLTLALEVLQLFQQMTSTTNTMLRSDLAVAAILAEASARSAAWNVRINLPQLEDASRTSQIQAQLSRDLETAERLCKAIELACV